MRAPLSGRGVVVLVRLGRSPLVSVDAAASPSSSLQRANLPPPDAHDGAEKGAGRSSSASVVRCGVLENASVVYNLEF